MTDIIEQWNTKTIGGSTKLSVDDFELIQDNIHLQDRTYSALEIVDLVGRITNNRSASGPIPGTGKIEVISTTSSGSIVAGFQPGPGEVWQIVGAMSTNGSGTSGTIYLEVKLYDIPNGRRAEIVSTSTTTGTDIPLTETTQNPIFIDENFRLEAEATGTFTEMVFRFPMVRVR